MADVRDSLFGLPQQGGAYIRSQIAGELFPAIGQQPGLWPFLSQCGPSAYVDLIQHSALQFSRASGGTTEVSPGVYATAAVNERRYAWMNGRRGLLIESAATNVLLYSDNLLAPPWYRRGTASIIADGEGGFQLSGIGNYDGLSGSNDVYQAPAPVASGIYAMSLFMRRGTNTGHVIISTPSGENFGAFSVNMALVGTTYERIALGHPAVTRTKPATATTDGGMHIRSDNTGTFFIKGCQVESGQATSSIKTLDTPATRAPDILTIATSVFGFNPNEGTFVCELVPLQNGGTIFDIYKPGVNFGVYSNSTAPNFVFESTGAPDMYYANISGQINKFAIGYSKLQRLVSVNGGLAGIQNAAIDTDLLLTMNIGRSRSGGSILGSVIFSLPYYPRKYSAAELQTAST